MDLIEIPNEFKNLTIEEGDIPKIRKDKRTKRPFIKVRTNRDLTNYDAWRIHDRELLKQGGKTPCVTKIMLPPALLVKTFGRPAASKIGFEGSGDYDFEDSNLDVFNIYDYKQTDFYWGMNREDEFYERDIHKPPHKRRRKWPTVDEFWSLMEPKEFKLACQDHADWRKFKLWLKLQIFKFGA